MGSTPLKNLHTLRWANYPISIIVLKQFYLAYKSVNLAYKAPETREEHQAAMQDTPQPLTTGKLEISSTNHSQPAAGLLFLREEEFRAAQDMLFFALRDLTAAPDVFLSELGFGRAHHRCLHWIGRRPNMKVGELLDILAITKQSLARVLGPLIQQGYVVQVKGQNDRRQRLLALSEKGAALERKVFDIQRERLAAAYREAGGQAVEGFRRVVRAMTKEQGRKYLDEMDAARAKGSRTSA
jgi:DNA-binding MarR family transcriptional regulator